MNKIYSRNPIIALDYSEKHKAVPKELLVDYKTGNIYIVSEEDKEVIFDITSQIKDQISEIKGSNIDVEIEGVGTFNLQELLNNFQTTLDDSVQVVELGEQIGYVGKTKVIDDITLSATKTYIGIKGFREAEDLTIPQKKDGKLIWVPMVELGSDDNQKPIGPGDGGTGSGEIIPPSNPDDADSLKAIIIEPSNDKIYLRASRRQKSTNLNRNCSVVIPRTLDQYSEIQWYVVTSEEAILLGFPNNIYWNTTDISLKPNSRHVYNFKTWDNGESWIGEMKTYCNKSNTLIDRKYLEENYYNKVQVDDKFYDKNQTFTDKEVAQLVSWKDHIE